ncbi:hypothetical protein GGF42_009481, partial [Coemansia sp. RSA 2424]
ADLHGLFDPGGSLVPDRVYDRHVSSVPRQGTVARHCRQRKPGNSPVLCRRMGLAILLVSAAVQIHLPAADYHRSLGNHPCLYILHAVRPELVWPRKVATRTAGAPGLARIAPRRVLCRDVRDCPDLAQ